MKRFFIDSDLKIGDEIIVDGKEYNYIYNVMRLRKGSDLILFNGNGYEYEAVIVEESKKSLTLKINNRYKNEVEPSINLDLYQASIKNKNIKLVVQKSVELGINSITLFSSDYTSVDYKNSKKNKLSEIAQSSVEQSGRNKNIEINQRDNIEQVIDDLKKYDKVVFCYEKSDLLSKSSQLKLENCKNIAVLVGPEGGFSSSEYEKLIQSLDNISVISLGKRILRAETAAITSIALVMNKLGEI